MFPIDSFNITGSCNNSDDGAFSRLPPLFHSRVAERAIVRRERDRRERYRKIRVEMYNANKHAPEGCGCSSIFLRKRDFPRNENSTRVSPDLRRFDFATPTPS